MKRLMIGLSLTVALIGSGLLGCKKKGEEVAEVTPEPVALEETTIAPFASPSTQPEEQQDESKLIEEAKEFFQNLVKLGEEFDSKLADLYSDEAVIKSKRIYSTGQVKEMEIPVDRYRQMIKMSMPVAKYRGDISKFDNVEYEVKEDGYVKITARRYSVLKDYYSTYYIVIGKDERGQWLIYEEYSETRPK